MTLQPEALLEKILSEHNYSKTTPRREVFHILLEGVPLFMHEIVTRASIDRVSVYRIIALYEKLGIAQRITVGWKYKIELSDIFLDHHHHISCLTCGRLQAIKESQALEDSIHALGEATGFQLVSHQLELQGYCHSCKNQTTKETK